MVPGCPLPCYALLTGRDGKKVLRNLSRIQGLKGRNSVPGPTVMPRVEKCPVNPCCLLCVEDLTGLDINHFEFG